MSSMLAKRSDFRSAVTLTFYTICRKVHWSGGAAAVGSLNFLEPEESLVFRHRILFRRQMVISRFPAEVILKSNQEVSDSGIPAF